MADNTILMLEAVSMFLGNADPTKSKHLKLTSLTLPTLEYDIVDHKPGGGAMEVGFSMSAIKKLEPTFKMAGFDQEAFRLFGVGSGAVSNFTCYGVIRDKREAKPLQGKAVFRGSIGRIAADAFTRGAEFGHDHRIDEVTHYELSIGGSEWYSIDFFTQPKPRVFGVEDREYMQMLGLA
jgi:phage tail tube protein FII